MTIYRTSKGNYEQHEEVDIFTKKYTVNVGGKTSITCDGQMYYGEPDPFPEMPVDKPIETTNEELVLFFRSETQAEGFPKRDKIDKVLIDNVEEFKPLRDVKYTQSFGFEFYRPDLYKINSEIFENNINTKVTLEKSFEIDGQLSLEIKNKKGKSKFIDKEFSLVKNKPLGSQNYYIPNLLIAKGKTITIYAKYFCLENEKVTATITFSDPTGIDNYTQKITFSKAEEIQPVIITTSTTVAIPEKATLSITIEKDGVTKVIGKCTLFPNKEYRTNLIFIDVTYNNTVSSTANYTTLIKDLNEKAFNQAGINIVKSSNQYSLNLNPKDCLRIQSGKSIINSDTLDKSINPQNQITNFDNVLNIARYKFYEKLALSLITEIELEFKKIKLKDKTGKEYSLIAANENLEVLIKDDLPVLDEDSVADREIKKQMAYNKLIYYIISFIDECKANFHIALMCNNLETASTQTAVGSINERGLIVSKSGVNDYETLAHEIGHNFGLGHTFTEAGQSNDLSIKKYSTLENVMDYKTNYSQQTSFITFQWIKMQKSLDRYSKTTSDLDITSTKIINGGYCLEDSTSNYLENKELYVNYFSKQIMLSVFSRIVSSETDQKEALKVISTILQNTINKLES